MSSRSLCLGSDGYKTDPSEDHGHTLIEAVVALAILLIVLAPAAGVLAVLVSGQAATGRIAALALVETALEDAIMNEVSSDSTWTIDYPPVELERRTSRHDGLISISVTARRAGRDTDEATLHAVILAGDR